MGKAQAESDFTPDCVCQRSVTGTHLYIKGVMMAFFLRVNKKALHSKWKENNIVRPCKLDSVWSAYTVA